MSENNNAAPAPKANSTGTASTLAPQGVKPLSFQQLMETEEGLTDLDNIADVKPKEKPKDILNEPRKEKDSDLEDENEGLEDENLGEEDEESEEEDMDGSEDEAKGDAEGDEADESDEKEDGEGQEAGSLGDDDLERKLKVKIDGRYETRTLKDWMRLISSGAHNLSKFKTWESQKSVEQKSINELKAQIGIANAKITPAWEKLKNKDVEGTIYELATAAGYSKLEVSRRLRDQMLPAIAQRLGLSEQEIRQRLGQMEPHNRALDVQEENEFLKAERKRLEEANKPREPDAVALEEQKFQAMMIEHGFSRADLKWAYEWLHEKAPEGMKPNLTVETVQNTILNRRLVEKAFDAIEAKRPSLTKRKSFVDRTIRKARENPTWSVSQLASWVESKAQKLVEVDKQNQVQELTRDVSRKALKTKGKDGFANPNVSKRAMRFNDLVQDDQSSDNLI